MEITYASLVTVEIDNKEDKKALEKIILIDVPTAIYPNVFDITMFNEDQTHRIARCCLTSIQVDHSGAGVNSTFYDDYPVETNLNLVFTELEILHKEKIDQGY